jgi:hypothetical protein
MHHSRKQTQSILNLTRGRRIRRRLVWCTPGAGEIVELAGAGEDDEADLGVAEDREFLRLLQKPVPPLRESHLPAGWVVDPTDHDLPPPHQRVRFRDLGIDQPKRKGRRWEMREKKMTELRIWERERERERERESEKNPVRFCGKRERERDSFFYRLSTVWFGLCLGILICSSVKRNVAWWPWWGWCLLKWKENGGFLMGGWFCEVVLWVFDFTACLMEGWRVGIGRRNTYDYIRERFGLRSMVMVVPVSIMLPLSFCPNVLDILYQPMNLFFHVGPLSAPCLHGIKIHEFIIIKWMIVRAIGAFFFFFLIPEFQQFSSIKSWILPKPSSMHVKLLNPQAHWNSKISLTFEVTVTGIQKFL